MKINNVEFGYFNGGVSKIHFFDGGKIVGTIETSAHYSYLVNSDDYSKYSDKKLQGITVDAELPSRAKKITMKKKEVCIGKDVDKQDYEDCNNALYIHANLVGFEDLGEQQIDIDADGTKRFRSVYRLHGKFTVRRYKPRNIHGYNYDDEEVNEVLVYGAKNRLEYGEEYKRKEALAEELNTIFNSKKLSIYDITAMEKVFTLTRKEALK